MATTKTPAKSTRKSATTAKPAANATTQKASRGPRFGPTECHAPGCDGTRYLKNSLLCQEHEQAWRRGEFRLSARGWNRLNAERAAAGQKPLNPATGKPATGAAAKKLAEQAATVATPAADNLEAELAASVAAAPSRFATPELEAAAKAKRARR